MESQRKIKNCFYPLEIHQSKDIAIPRLAAGEERILSVDVGLMSSAKNANDASTLIINSAIPINDTSYSSNIVYLENHEGLSTDDLGLIVMRTFYKYHCTQLVLDTNGRNAALIGDNKMIMAELNGNAEMPTRSEGYM